MPFSSILLAGYIKELFIVDGAEEGSLVSLLPWIVTAICLGVVLAGLWFTISSCFERMFLTRLMRAQEASQSAPREEGSEAGSIAGVTFAELGYTTTSCEARLMRWLLRRPSCSLYRFIGHTEAEAISEELAKLAASPAATTGEAPTSGGITLTEGEQKAAEREAKKAKRTAFKNGAKGYLLPEDNRYYLLEGTKDKADERIQNAGAAAWMSLVYASLFSIGAGFIILNLLDRLVALFGI